MFECIKCNNDDICKREYGMADWNGHVMDMIVS